jgi:hypothetical protein
MPANIGAASGSGSQASGNTAVQEQATLENGTPGPSPAPNGTALLTLRPGRGSLCYDLNVFNMPVTTAANIRDSTGSVVLSLTAPAGGTVDTCTAVSDNLINSIIAQPGSYSATVTGQSGVAISGQFQPAFRGHF